MALASVGARIEGDVFQGLFFWKEAARLLLPDSRVRRVELEHDAADGVDDVAVFYDAPGVNAGGFLATADFYQLKYHVDRREGYSADALIDPSFIKAERSLLKRFFEAYERLAREHAGVRLHLASNWSWSGDKLGEQLREFDGALPEAFFTSTPASSIGKIRESWLQHLALKADAFEPFARTLRFQTDHFGRRHFRELVHGVLAQAGLKIPPPDRGASPYESLTQRFLTDRCASFDRDSFRALCEREDLFAEGGVESRRSRTIAVRSYLRFAENIEDEAATVVSVTEDFSGRHPKNPDSWVSSTETIRTAFADAALRNNLRTSDHDVMLECHGSFALLTGYELSNNSGALVYPIQKPGRAIWKPAKPYVGELWARSEATVEGSIDLVVTISVTHDVRNDVDSFLKQSELGTHARIDLHPASGTGPTSIKGADHAAALAAAFVGELKRARPSPVSRVHLFAAAPNALLFFIGQHREALGRIQIYEFDFSLERDGSYAASIAIPFDTTEH